MVRTGHGGPCCVRPHLLRLMTDAPRTQSATAAPSGVTEPLRGLLTRAAVLLRDRAGLESVALLLPMALVGARHATGPGLWLVSAGYLLASAMLASQAPSRSAPTAGRWTTARLLLSVAMVTAGQLFTGSTGLLAAVYLPIIAIAAFAGHRFVLLAVATSIGAHFLAEAIDRGDFVEAAHRALGFGGAAVLVAFGTRREVGRMQRARRPAPPRGGARSASCAPDRGDGSDRADPRRQRPDGGRARIGGRPDRGRVRLPVRLHLP